MAGGSIQDSPLHFWRAIRHELEKGHSSNYCSANHLGMGPFYYPAAAETFASPGRIPADLQLVPEGQLRGPMDGAGTVLQFQVCHADVPRDVPGMPEKESGRTGAERPTFKARG